jgi:hypothetical protein
MSIRNKRLKKELLKLPESLLNELTLNENWENDLIVTIYHEKNNISIELDNQYPFSFPKLYIHSNSKPINYIDWFLKDRSKFTKIVNDLNIKIDCICCNTITCTWSPVSGIQDIINEYEKHYNKYYKLTEFNTIFNKINGFDNLIYKNILDFLY